MTIAIRLNLMISFLLTVFQILILENQFYTWRLNKVEVLRGEKQHEIRGAKLRVCNSLNHLVKDLVIFLCSDDFINISTDS